MRWFSKYAVMVLLGMPVMAPAQASGETLADIRQELSVLYVELQRLKRELSTTGGASQGAVGSTVIDRVNVIEGELQRLTSKTEQLEFRIDRVVTDGTNRVGDLEFRICELEPSCNVGTLEVGDTLGGVAPATTGIAADATGGGTQSAGLVPESGIGGGASVIAPEDSVELAVGERADFDAALATFNEGSHAEAAEQFAAFQTNYPGSPLGADAGLKRGEALELTGETTQAARAYLDTFSAEPNGVKAPDALFLLGRALGRLGQTNEACVTLSEVGARFPNAAVVPQAQAEIQTIGCG